MSPLLAQSGHDVLHCICPLSGVKRTCRFALLRFVFDPKRHFVTVWTFASERTVIEAPDDVAPSHTAALRQDHGQTLPPPQSPPDRPPHTGHHRNLRRHCRSAASSTSIRHALCRASVY